MSVTFLEISHDGGIGERGVGLAAPAREVCRATAEMYRTTGFTPPWIGYLAFEGGQAVGTCAFKAAPSDGAVEIAYFTFPGHEGQGIATAMARQLVAIALGADPALRIVAHTLPEPGASNAVLQKLDFVLLGDWEDPVDGTVWEWQLG